MARPGLVLVSNHPWSVLAASDRNAIPTGALEAAFALYRKSAWAGVIPNNLFDAVMGEFARQLFARGAVAYVATNPTDTDHWLALVLVEWTSDDVPVVHLAYAKSTYRDSAVLTSLFDAAGIDTQARLFYTVRCGGEHKAYPAGRFAPEIARRKSA